MTASHLRRMSIAISSLVRASLLLTAYVLTAGLTLGSAAKVDTSEKRIERVENRLMKVVDGKVVDVEMGLVERMEHYHVPGVSIAVISDFGIEWAKGYGVLEAGGNQLVEPDTLFHAGSIAKPVAAAAALALVERGLLDLDKNVNDNLISWQVPENEFTVKGKSHASPVAESQCRLESRRKRLVCRR